MMRTKLFRCVAIVGFICAFSSIAAANDFSITWRDPPASPTTTYNTTPILSVGVTTPFQFDYPMTTGYGCPADQASSQSDLCASFYNETESTLTSMELQFTVGSNLDGQTIGCTTGSTDVFTANNCSDYSAGLTSGEIVTLYFTGGSLAPGSNLFLDLSGLPVGTTPSDFLNPSVTAVPEPGSMLLLGGGLGLLFLLGFRRRRVKASC